MSNNPLALFCLVDGEATSNAFPVSAPISTTISELKKLIKTEKAINFSDIDADQLTLWRVTHPVIAANKHQPVSLDAIDSPVELDPLDDIADVFTEPLPEKTIHIIVQRPPITVMRSFPLAKRGRSHITTAGPVQWHGPSLMLPFSERSLFEEVHRGICAGNSFVVHGPCQSGKTSFLMALQSQLESSLDEASVVYFDISDLSIPSDTQEETAILDLISRFWSFRVFRKELSWASLMALSLDHRYCVLVDEFQWVFRSPAILNAVKKFFRNLSSKTAVSYVAIGTFLPRELLMDDGPMESPFNKAHFARMPPFDLREMSKLFDMYKENCDPVGISNQIQIRIIDESGGHPASFMFLLKLALLCRPDEGNWTRLLQDNIGSFLNGT